MGLVVCTGFRGRRPGLNDHTPDPEAVAEDATPGPLLDPEEAEALEAHDRAHSGPGGEPECPRCGTKMVRKVEAHRAPRADDSPFRVRVVCPSPACGVWTVYNW